MKKLTKKTNERTRYYSPEALKRMRAYKIKYNHETYRTYTCRLNKENDKDVIKQIYAQKNSTDYIRKLVREDIAKKKEIDNA